MRASDIITIYLAVGAPFGASYFLRQRTGAQRGRRLLQATLAALLWPLLALRTLFASEESLLPGTSQVESQQHVLKIEEAVRRFLAALYVICEVSPAALGRESEKMERAAYLLRASTEKYVGLALAVSESTLDGHPDERELEVFRVAGRTGDDLLLAGRCTHRRNVVRLRVHHARARGDLVHALAEIREASQSQHSSAAPTNTAAHCRLSTAITDFYGCAVDLLTLLGDEDAAMSAARLLDQEYARQQCLHSVQNRHDSETELGEESCRAHSFRPSHARLRQETTPARG